MTRELTGRHVLIITVSAFGVIIAANLAMLFAATGSFPGLVVENSYVASQGWNARTDAQRDLGWESRITYTPGAVVVELTGPDGRAVNQADLVLSIGRPSSDAADRVLRPEPGTLRFAVDLAPGTWRLDLSTASGPNYRMSANLLVPEPE